MAFVLSQQELLGSNFQPVSQKWHGEKMGHLEKWLMSLLPICKKFPMKAILRGKSRKILSGEKEKLF